MQEGKWKRVLKENKMGHSYGEAVQGRRTRTVRMESKRRQRSEYIIIEEWLGKMREKTREERRRKIEESRSAKEYKDGSQKKDQNILKSKEKGER
jgi:hypothetical protein